MREQLIEYWKKCIEDQDPNRFKNLGTPAKLSETSRRQKAVQALNNMNKKVKSIAILTSENPHFEGSAGGTDNKEARKHLEDSLRSGHIAWFPIQGKYGDFKEKSYMIFNISREDAVRLGKKYAQESIIFIKDNKCEFWSSEDGVTYKPTQIRELSQKIDVTDPEDDFSSISRAFKFRIPFFDGSDENEELYKGMVDQISESLSKRNLTEKQIDRYINDVVENKVKGFNKWARNGQLYRSDFWW